VRIVITQPDAKVPLGIVELDLTEYNFRDRRHHGGIPVHDDTEWKFRLDAYLGQRGIMRLSAWGEVRNTSRFCHYKKSIIGYRATVRLDM
jgi:hypothetical protein